MQICCTSVLLSTSYTRNSLHTIPLPPLLALFYILSVYSLYINIAHDHSVACVWACGVAHCGFRLGLWHTSLFLWYIWLSLSHTIIISLFLLFWTIHL